MCVARLASSARSIAARYTPCVGAGRCRHSLTDCTRHVALDRPIVWLDRGVNLESQVGAWLAGYALAELAQSGFAQVDIDELLDPPPARAVSTMLDCMELAVARVTAEDVQVAGMVVIPLPFVDDQALPPTNHPTLTDLLHVDWVYGPGLEVPGLWLLSPGAEKPDPEVEEYRLGLPRSDREHQIWYRAWRTLDERERFPQEWSRALYIRRM